MKEELIDVLDENGIKTGQIMTRNEIHKQGLNKESVKFQKEEVQDIKFVSISELNELRNTDQLVPRDEVYDVLAEYLFRM